MEHGWPARLSRATRWLETALLVLLLVLLLGLGLTQIVLRNLFDGALLWADPVIRAGVLWLGLVGAVAASRETRHIRIDLLQRWLTGWPLALVEAVTSGFAAAVCAVIAWHGGRLVLEERAFAVPGDFLPAWILQLVIPGAFGAMAVLHALHAASQRGGRLR